MSGHRNIDADKAERETRANATEFLSSPPISDLTRALDQIAPKDYRAVVGAVRPLAENVSWLTGQVDAWLDRVIHGEFQPPVFGIQDHGLDFDDSGLMLYMHPLLNVSVASL